MNFVQVSKMFSTGNCDRSKSMSNSNLAVVEHYSDILSNNAKVRTPNLVYSRNNLFQYSC